jgi:hypothetical protein
MSLVDGTTNYGQWGIDSVTSNDASRLITKVVIGILLALILLNGYQYFVGADVSAYLSNLFTQNPELDIIIDTPITGGTSSPSPVPEIKLRKQVFNIPENNFVYEDAKALCSAYGAKLATYSQIEDAYDNGGEWCNYGWSDGQMALYPTQKKTWEQLQQIEGHENDCGRPGINGGYIDNPKVKFGVNCYGYKPRMTDTEQELMNTASIYPQTEKEKAMEQRVNYWKSHLTEVLVSPFNSSSWSRI